jgi:hypothetical protein
MTTYIEELARRIRSHVDADLVPEGDAEGLFLIYAVLALAKGKHVDRRDVHNGWAAWMVTRDPTHESIEPFDDLSPEKKREDDPFVSAIRAAATEGS